MNNVKPRKNKWFFPPNNSLKTVVLTLFMWKLVQPPKHTSNDNHEISPFFYNLLWVTTFDIKTHKNPAHKWLKRQENCNGIRTRTSYPKTSNSFLPCVVGYFDHLCPFYSRTVQSQKKPHLHIHHAQRLYYFPIVEHKLTSQTNVSFTVQ